MYFNNWRKLQRDKEMFNISLGLVCEGIKRENFENIVHNFLSFAKKELSIRELPKIQLVV